MDKGNENKKISKREREKVKQALKQQRGRELKGKETNLKTYMEIIMIILLMKKGYTFVIRKANKKSERTKQFITLMTICPEKFTEITAT